MGAALLSDPDKIEAVSTDKHFQYLVLYEFKSISLIVSGSLSRHLHSADPSKAGHRRVHTRHV